MQARIVGVVGKKGSGKDTAADGLASDFYVKRSFATPLKEFLIKGLDFPEEALYGPSQMRNTPVTFQPSIVVGKDAPDRITMAQREFASKVAAAIGRDVDDMSRWLDDFILKEVFHSKCTVEIRPVFLTRTVTHVHAYQWTARRILQQLGTEWGRALDPDIWCKIAVQGLQEENARTVFSDCRFINEAAKIRELGGPVIRIYRPATDSTKDKHQSETEMDTAAFKEHVTHTVVNDGTREELHAKVSEAVSKHYGDSVAPPLPPAWIL